MAEGKGFGGGGQAFRDDAFGKRPSNPEAFASSNSKRRRRPRRKKHFGERFEGGGPGGKNRQKVDIKAKVFADDDISKSQPGKKSFNRGFNKDFNKGAGSLNKKSESKKEFPENRAKVEKKAEVKKVEKQPEWGSFSEGTKDVEEDEQPVDVGSPGVNLKGGEGGLESKVAEEPKIVEELKKVDEPSGAEGPKVPAEPEVSGEPKVSAEPEWAKESNWTTDEKVADEPKLSKESGMEVDMEQGTVTSPETATMPNAVTEPDAVTSPGADEHAGGTPVFPSFDMGSANLPPAQYENRYRQDDFVSEGGADGKKSENSSIKSGYDGGFTAGAVPFTADAVTPFSAPMSSYEPSTLDKKALDEKPLDAISQTPVMPFSAPKIDSGEKDLVEDKENDEIPNESVSDVPNDEPEPIHKPVDFGESFGGESKKVPESDFGPSSQKEASYESFSKDSFGGSEVKVSDVSHSNESVTESHESSDEKNGFFQLLEEAGIKKSYILIFFGVLGGIVLVILFFVFGWYRIFTNLWSTSTNVASEVTTEQTGQTTGTESNTEISSSTSILPTQPGVSPEQLFELSGLVNSYIFGLEFSQRQVLPELDLSPVSSDGSLVGVDSSLAAGGPVIITKQSISGYVDLLFRIDNAVRTDVYDYLNHNVDRRLALREYLDLLNSLLSEAESTKTAVTREITRISSEYSLIQKEKDLYESTFFGSINTFHGDDAYNNLELFVEAKQSEVKKKADYSALATISNLLDKYISVLTPRINDISANSEALIKGVMVFYVPGSNINAIVPQ